MVTLKLFLIEVRWKFKGDYLDLQSPNQKPNCNDTYYVDVDDRNKIKLHLICLH